MGTKMSKEKGVVSGQTSNHAMARNSSKKKKNNHSRSFCNCFSFLKGNSDDVKSQDDQCEEEKKLDRKEISNKSQISSVNLNHDSVTSKKNISISSKCAEQSKSGQKADRKSTPHHFPKKCKKNSYRRSIWKVLPQLLAFLALFNLYDYLPGYCFKLNVLVLSKEVLLTRKFLKQQHLSFIPNLLLKYSILLLILLFLQRKHVTKSLSWFLQAKTVSSKARKKAFERKEICSSVDVHHDKEPDRCHSNYDNALATDNFQPPKTVNDDANSYKRKRNKSKFSLENGHKNAFVNQGGYVSRMETVARLPAGAVKVGRNGSSAKMIDGLSSSGNYDQSAPPKSVCLPADVRDHKVPGISPKSTQIEETHIEEVMSTSSRQPDNDPSGKFTQCNDQGEKISAELKVASNIIDNNLEAWEMAADDHKQVDSEGDVEAISSAEFNEQIQNSNNISEIRSHERESSVGMEKTKTKEIAVASDNEKNENPGRKKNKRKKKKKNSNTQSGGNTDNSVVHSSKNDVMSSPHSEIKQDDNLISSVIIRRQPRGLVNLGNTCFFNAVMQNLNQSFLLQHCLSNYLSQCAGKNSHSLTKAMDDFYKEMSFSKSSYNPSGVFHNVCKKSPRFSGGRQQDSHELLRHLLDGLRAEEREGFPQPERRKILTNIDKVFGGHFLTVYTCEECKTPYHVCEPMLDISLPIAFDDSEEEEVEDFTSGQLNLSKNMENSLGYDQAAKYLMSPLNENGKIQTEADNICESNSTNELLKKQNKTKGKREAAAVQRSSKRLRKERSVHDCLKAFTRVESIKEEYLCMTCNAGEGATTDPKMTSAKKRTLIYNPPALLTLHLKRFEQSPQGFVKCNDQISFESELDLGPYCSRYCKRNEQNERNLWYSLYGVVVHGGSLSGGHYVAYVKERSFEKNTDQYLQTQFLDRNLLTSDELVRQVKDFQCKFQAEWKPKSEHGSWYYISDCHSSRVDEREVMQQQVYLLFYERMARENMEASMAREKLENTETGL